MASSDTEEHPNAAYIQHPQHPQYPQLPDEEAHPHRAPPISDSSVNIIHDPDGHFTQSAIEVLYNSTLDNPLDLKNHTINQMPAYLKHIGVTLRGAARFYSDEFDGAMVVNMINDPLMSPEMWDYLRNEVGITGLKQKARLLTACKKSDLSQSAPSPAQQPPAATLPEALPEPGGTDSLALHARCFLR